MGFGNKASGIRRQIAHDAKQKEKRDKQVERELRRVVQANFIGPKKPEGLIYQEAKKVVPAGPPVPGSRAANKMVNALDAENRRKADAEARRIAQENEAIKAAVKYEQLQFNCRKYLKVLEALQDKVPHFEKEEAHHFGSYATFCIIILQNVPIAEAAVDVGWGDSVRGAMTLATRAANMLDVWGRAFQLLTGKPLCKETAHVFNYSAEVRRRFLTRDTVVRPST